jgi:hypothetical protein
MSSPAAGSWGSFERGTGYNKTPPVLTGDRIDIAAVRAVPRGHGVPITPIGRLMQCLGSSFDWYTASLQDLSSVVYPRPRGQSRWQPV